jgi:hypothetical protein
VENLNLDIFLLFIQGLATPVDGLKDFFDDFNSKSQS